MQLRIHLSVLFNNFLKILLGLITIILFYSTSYSQKTVVLDNASEMYQPRQEVSFLWDKKKNFTIDQITSSEFQNKFEQAGTKAISFGIKEWDMWLKVKVKNAIPEQAHEWVFELAYPHFDSLEFYYQDKNGKWQSSLTGDKLPFDTRKIFNKHFAYPINLPDTTTQVYYFHIGGEGSRQFPLFIQKRDSFYATQEKISMIYGGIFFGIIVIMLLYNFFIYLSLKDRVYLYYVMMNVSVLLFYLGYSGYGFQYIWSDYPVINSKVIPFGVILTGATTINFVRNFLESKKFVPWIDRILLGLLVSFIIALVLIAFLNYERSLKLTSLLATISALLILITSYRAWIKGNKSARFIALAFSIYLIGIVLLNSNIIGFLSRNFFVAHSMEVGTAIEITLLSLALSDKFSILKKEKEKAQSELIDVQRSINEELEKKVERRTLLINEQKIKLQESNRVKDKLLSIISHDLKGPLNAFQSLLSMMMKDEVTQEKISMYTMHLNNKLGLMVSLVDNILHWVRSQMDGMKFNIQPITLKDLVKENVNLFSSQAELKNITIIDEVPEDTFLLGDKNVVRLVIRNLLANALKFTENDGQVYISAIAQGDNILVEIRDTGIGMDEVSVKKLFTNAHFTTPDTNKKEGTGLGLLLCKEFLKKNSGEIWVESELDKGSSFKFTLPKSTAIA